MAYLPLFSENFYAVNRRKLSAKVKVHFMTSPNFITAAEVTSPAVLNRDSTQSIIIILLSVIGDSHETMPCSCLVFRENKRLSLLLTYSYSYLQFHTLTCL
jgi:hypothetical protein